MSEHQPAGTQQQPAYPDVHVQLTGTDGNAYAIIGAVTRELEHRVGRDAAGEFITAALACPSYDDLLRLAMATVTVH